MDPNFHRDENMTTSTLDFFDPAWNQEQIIYGVDNFHNISGYGNLPQTQNYLRANPDSHTEFFSAQPGQPLHQYTNDPFSQGNNDVGQVLTPGLSFLQLDTVIEPDIRTSGDTSPYTSFGLPVDVRLYGAAATQVYGKARRESLPVERRTSYVDPQPPKAMPRNFLDNETDKSITPTDRHVDVDMSSEGYGQTPRQESSTSTENQTRNRNAPSTIGKRRSSTAAMSDTLSTTAEIVPKPAKKTRRSKKKQLTREQQDVKRTRFLERNRLAAGKCRQNRKQWVDDLQERCHEYKTDNHVKKVALEEMGKEIMQIKDMLIRHAGSCEDEHIHAWIEKEACRIRRHSVAGGQDGGVRLGALSNIASPTESTWSAAYSAPTKSNTPI